MFAPENLIEAQAGTAVRSARRQADPSGDFDTGASHSPAPVATPTSSSTPTPAASGSRPVSPAPMKAAPAKPGDEWAFVLPGTWAETLNELRRVSAWPEMPEAARKRKEKAMTQLLAHSHAIQNKPCVAKPPTACPIHRGIIAEIAKLPAAADVREARDEYLTVLESWSDVLSPRQTIERLRGELDRASDPERAKAISSEIAQLSDPQTLRGYVHAMHNAVRPFAAKLDGAVDALVKAGGELLQKKLAAGIAAEREFFGGFNLAHDETRVTRTAKDLVAELARLTASSPAREQSLAGFSRNRHVSTMTFLLGI